MGSRCSSRHQSSHNGMMPVCIARRRGVQERLKEEIPDTLSNQEEIAYSLVPKAMDIVFGEQESAWKTEKRPSKSGNGYTTWIVTIEADA